MNIENRRPFKPWLGGGELIFKIGWLMVEIIVLDI